MPPPWVKCLDFGAWGKEALRGPSLKHIQPFYWLKVKGRSENAQGADQKSIPLARTETNQTIMPAIPADGITVMVCGKKSKVIKKFQLLGIDNYFTETGRKKNSIGLVSALPAAGITNYGLPQKAHI